MEIRKNKTTDSSVVKMSLGKTRNINRIRKRHEYVDEIRPFFERIFSDSAELQTTQPAKLRMRRAEMPHNQIEIILK